MSSNISFALVKWKECLTLNNQQEQEDAFSSQVKRIYEECIALQYVQSDVLSSKANISLKTDFLKFKERISGLFLRTLIKENNLSILDDSENHEVKTNILRLAEFLYKGNNTRAELILSKFPEALRRQIFLNIWRLLGRPSDTDDIGEHALLNRMGWNTSPSDKVQALISCFNLSFAVRICAHIGDAERLQMILPGRTPDDEEVDLTEALISACSNGHTSCLAVLLANRISFTQLSRALTSAVEHRQIDCVNLILRKREGRADLLECMQIAVRNNFNDIFALLLKQVHGDKEILADILSFVSKEGRIDFLHMILSDGYQNSIHKQTLLDSLRESAVNGHIHLLQKLFAVEVVDNQLNDLDLLPLIYATAKLGHSDCLQFLISKVSLNGVTLTFLDQAIVIAIENQHLSALHVLLEGRVQPIRHQELILSLKSIFNNRYLYCLEILLEYDRLINDNIFARFVSSVVKNRQYDILMVILASRCKNKIDRDEFNILLGTSVDIQDVECFKLLLADGRDKQVTTKCIERIFYKISFLGNLPLMQIFCEYNFDEILGEPVWANCLYSTASFNHAECLNVLLTRGKDTKISLDNLGVVFRVAAKKGYADCLKVFFDQNLHPKILAIDFGLAMTHVVDNNDIENLRLFLEKDRYQLIPEYDLCEAIRISSINKRIDILELLHGNDRYKQFLPERLDQSMRSAIDLGHTEVVYFLLEKYDLFHFAIETAIVEGQEDLAISLLQDERCKNLSANAWLGLYFVGAQYGNFSFLAHLFNLFGYEKYSICVFKASSSGNYECLKRLLSLKRHIRSDEFSHTVLYTVKAGQDECLRELFSSNNTVTSKALGESLCIASENGFDNCVEILVTRVKSINAKDLGSSVQYCIENGHDKCLHHILVSLGSFIRFQEIVEFLSLAINKGNHACVFELLSNCSEICQQRLAKEMELACVKGDVNCLNVLFDYSDDLSSLEQFTFVRLAAEHGNKEILAFLFSQELKLSQKDLSQVMNIAAEHGHLACLSFLFLQGFEKSQVDVSQIMKVAAEHGHLACLSFLFAKGINFSEKDMMTAVESSTENGHIDCLKFFLSKSLPLTKFNLVSLIHLAAKNGHIDCLDQLFLLCPIVDQHDLDKAIAVAIQSGSFNAVWYLLSNGGHIREQFLGPIVKHAAENGLLQDLKRLVTADTKIEQEDLALAVKLAAQNKHHDCIRHLLSQGRQINQYYFNWAVIAAVSSGDDSTVHYLLNSTQSITESAKLLALKYQPEKSSHAIDDLLEIVQTIADTEGSSKESPFSLMKISLEMLHNDPVRLFGILSSQELPRAFSLEEYPSAKDLAEISKYVYFSLFDSLLQRDVLYLNAFQMPYLDSQEGKDLYEKLGSFFSHLANRNSRRKRAFVTGPVFSHHFFALVKQALSNIDDITAVQQIINQSQMKHEGSVEFASEDINGYLTPVISFIHGMQNSGVSDLLVKQLQELSPLELSEMMQGKTVSIPLVLDSLQIEDAHATVVFAEHVAWIQEKILHEDQNWLRKFVIAFTGQNALSAYDKLKITPIALERGSTFAMNPYLRVLEIPNIPMNKEEFLTAFERMIVGSPDFLQ